MLFLRFILDYVFTVGLRLFGVDSLFSGVYSVRYEAGGFHAKGRSIFPQTGFSCRGPGGVVLNHWDLRGFRLGNARVNDSPWASDLQKKIVEM